MQHNILLTFRTCKRVGEHGIRLEIEDGGWYCDGDFNMLCCFMICPPPPLHLHLHPYITPPPPSESRHTEICNKPISSVYGSNHRQIHLDKQDQVGRTQQSMCQTRWKWSHFMRRNRAASSYRADEGKESHVYFAPLTSSSNLPSHIQLYYRAGSITTRWCMCSRRKAIDTLLFEVSSRHIDGRATMTPTFILLVDTSRSVMHQTTNVSMHPFIPL